MSDVTLSREAQLLVRQPYKLQAFLAEHPEVNVDKYKDAVGWTALHHTCTFQKGLDSAVLLLDHGADVNALTDNGNTGGCSVV
jgi:ankyrin repeat protein